MAESPAHRFGQIIGDLLEEIILPQLQEYCDERGLYLDKKGARGTARKGRKVKWQDKFENFHDLDFVIEAGGTAEKVGRPLAFIEAAWRRYTKHSRAKAQEIQGAVLPIADKHHWDKPFLGAILAGVFTKESLEQMRSCGFETMLMPYDSIVAAFASVGVKADFDESTKDAEFTKAVKAIVGLSRPKRAALKKYLVENNSKQLKDFFDRLKKAIGRAITRIIVIPLHGAESTFESVDGAMRFLAKHQPGDACEGPFRKYEIIVKYSNDDRVDAFFEDKEAALGFLTYVGSSGL